MRRTAYKARTCRPAPQRSTTRTDRLNRRSFRPVIHDCRRARLLSDDRPLSSYIPCNGINAAYVRNRSNGCTSLRSRWAKAHCVPPATLLQPASEGSTPRLSQRLLDEAVSEHAGHGPSVRSCRTTAHAPPPRRPPHPVRPGLIISGPYAPSVTRWSHEHAGRFLSRCV